MNRHRNRDTDGKACARWAKSRAALRDWRVAALVLLACGVAVNTFAQGAFPTKAVRIIVPQTPGGASDTLARIVGRRLAEIWHQPVVVENRAGAGGNIGNEAVAKAAPDGYTWLLGYAGTHAINPALYKNLPFDTKRDFVAVASLARLPFVMVVHPSVPAKSLAEFIAFAKANPGTVMASSGNGSVNHLVGEMLSAATNIKMTHVPYKGAAAALTDLVGGQVQVFFASAPSVVQFIRRGAVRALAVSSAKRAQSLAEVPTFAEAGVRGIDVNPWFGVFAPAATPRELVKPINAEINKVLAMPDIAEKFLAQGAEPFATTPSEFAAIVSDDLELWARVVRESGAKVD
jgi:tripartite-type tricarboxylate transporter receptor subunit TctC